MPRYFFHLHNDVQTEDEEGRECPGLEAARRAAFDEARTMASASVLEGHLNLSHAVVVTDSRGRQVLEVRFADAVEIQR